MLRLLYVMDPLSRVLVDKDTTFAFMLEGERRGHEQYHCGVEDLFVEQAAPHASVRRARVQRAAVHFSLAGGPIQPVSGVAAGVMPKDPPLHLAGEFASQ